MDLTKLYSETLPAELGSFRAAEGWRSEDRNALYVPRLRLSPFVVRRVAQGATIFGLFSAAKVVEHRTPEPFLCPHPVSYVWGALKVFETGEPEIVDTLFLRGRVTAPNLREVMQYLTELRRSSKQAL